MSMENRYCYGSYGSRKDLCGSCDCRQWCKDAGDLKVDKNNKQLELVVCDTGYAAQPDVYREKEKFALNEINGALAEVIAGIHALNMDNKLKRRSAKKALNILERICDFTPATCAVTLEKFLHPELSYSRIGDKFGMRKQSVAKHLKKAVKQIPELEHALVVDRRFMPKKAVKAL